MNIQTIYKESIQAARNIELRDEEMYQVDDIRSDGFILWVTEQYGLSVAISDKGLGDEIRVVEVDSECYPSNDDTRTTDIEEVVELLERFASERGEVAA